MRMFIELLYIMTLIMHKIHGGYWSLLGKFMRAMRSPRLMLHTPSVRRVPYNVPVDY